MLPYNKKLTQNARELRRAMTAEEKKLWYKFLKKLPVAVKRQKNIENYIVDFYIPSSKLVIEIDGVQHMAYDHAEADKKRDSELSKWGIKVLRYSNVSINSSFTEVTEDILDNLGLSFDDLKE